MFIGHLPIGYVCTKLLFNKILDTGVTARLFIGVGLLGAVAPDLDLFYSYFIDYRQHHHHTFWPHYPIVWVTLLLSTILWLRYTQRKAAAVLAMVFSLCGFIHILLDTVVGDIWWLAPFIDKPFKLFTVPILHQPWWLSFILHWSFILEIAACSWAILLWRRTGLRS